MSQYHTRALTMLHVYLFIYLFIYLSIFQYNPPLILDDHLLGGGGGGEGVVDVGIEFSIS